MKKIEALIPPHKVDEIKEALLSLDEFQDMTISDVTSFSRYNNSTAFYRGVAYNVGCLHKVKIEVIVEDDEVRRVADTIFAAVRTGQLCDCRISILSLEEIVRVRPGKNDRRGSLTPVYTRNQKESSFRVVSKEHLLDEQKGQRSGSVSLVTRRKIVVF